MKRIPMACNRCLAEAHVDWLEVTRFGEIEPDYLMGRVSCLTTRCVDENGSSLVQAPIEAVAG